MRNNMKWLVALAVMLSGLVGAAQAEMKIGYIDSEKILNQYKPYLDAQKEFQRYEEELEREVSKRQNELVKMQETFERQALLLSDKRKQEEQQAIIQKQRDLQNFVQEAADPQRGRLAQKTAELSEPIIRKVNEIITKVAEDEGYDFVLNSAALAYAKEVHELTGKVLDALAKDLETTTKAGGQ
ncbi:MAG: OmpH family outer membrane protein [Candidatus Latescibacteria bacterium]|jgi:outer membrane protein|nr:OmpH family outer membrane protein [Candidatus Latescibacterota bacterium]